MFWGKQLYFGVIFLCFLVLITACGPEEKGETAPPSDSNNPPTDSNNLPSANASNDFTARVNEFTFLDGRGSTDKDGDDLIFIWSMKSAPNSSTFQISTPSTAVTKFKAEDEGVYTVKLTVSDGKGGISTDEVRISVDLDGDGAISANDVDRDGDGILNDQDEFPDNISEYIDTNNDGIGNYAQPDEDGDLVLDNMDFFPFDPLRSDYTTILEEEFNDNPTQANVTGTTYPFRVEGTISKNIDGDYFKFPASAGDIITTTLYKSNENFRPSITISTMAGNPLQAVQPNFGKGRPFHTAVTVTIPKTGDYLLVINELDSKGSPEYAYSSEVFRDTDLDALDDNREIAVGSTPFSPDIDADGIFDSTETTLYLAANVVDLAPTRTNFVSDMDSDGIPNWFDIDSDGDFIPDETEGAEDNDNDGQPNFLDYDSDGNGISDDIEAGANPSLPIDSDLDSIIDPLDADDDQDGVLDYNDSNRLTTIEAVSPLNIDDPLIVYNSYSTINDENIDGIASVGESLFLSGEGFDTTLNENIVVFYGASGKTRNITPISATYELIEVKVPDIGVLDIAVVVRDRISNKEPVTLISNDIPLLFSPGLSIATVEDTVTFYGRNLFAPININFGGSITSAFGSIDGNSLTVTIPPEANSGLVNVITSSGTSNAVNFTIETNVTGQLTLPDSLNIDITTLSIDSGLLGETATNSSGTFTSKHNNSEPNTIASYLPKTTEYPQTVLFSSYILPGDDNIEINALSTAIDRTMTALFIFSQSSTDKLTTARTTISTLPEILELAQKIEELAILDPYFQRESLSGELLTLAKSAITAAYNAISTNKQSTRTTTLKAEIDPEEQYGISVIQQDEPNHGNIKVINDTALYLSAQIKDIKSGSLLQPHISGAFERNIIPPQWSIVYLSKEKLYSQPNFKDAEIEVLTAGILPLDTNNLVKTNLQIRTIIDSFFAPILGKIIGIPIKGKEKIIYNLVAGIAPNILNDVLTAFNEGNFGDATTTFMGFLIHDLSSPGRPFTTALLTSLYGKNATAIVIEKILERIIKRFAILASVSAVASSNPAGWIVIAVYTADFILPLANASIDIASIPPKLNFIVDFPLEIFDIDPKSIRATENDISIEIEGVGFSAITEGLFFKTTKLPEVTFIDEDSGSQVTVDGKPEAYSMGSIMTATIPAAFRKNAAGPISIKVEHGNNEAKSEEKIEIAELRIDSLSPNKGKNGTLVVISGSGFSDVKGENKVTFETRLGRASPIMFISAKESELKVLAPPQVISGDVIVKVEDKESNGVPFNMNFVTIPITFGDDGSLNDDTFALFVDNELIFSMPEPARTVRKDVELEEGDHKVILRGITAPDDIGTYYINFGYTSFFNPYPANISNISGAPLQGRDLTAGVEKHYTITVYSSSSSRSRTIDGRKTNQLILQDE